MGSSLRVFILTLKSLSCTGAYRTIAETAWLQPVGCDHRRWCGRPSDSMRCSTPFYSHTHYMESTGDGQRIMRLGRYLAKML